LWTVVALAGAAFAFMEWVAVTQWLSGHWYLADVGNIHYCLFNTLHGSFMASPQHDAINHFAFHFTPFLLLLLPLVPLSVYPVPLVTSYVVALALCVPAVFALARREGVDPWGGVALAWLFLANHFVGSLELANHFEVFYLLFILLAMAARGTRWLFPLALLAMTVKEDAALWIAGWAAVECWFAGGASQRKRSAWLIAGALACLAVAGATILILQRIHGQGAMTEYGPRFRGMSFGFDSLLTFALLLGSFALLPLLAGRRAVLILLPVPVLLSNFPFMRHQLYYYSYPFLPFLAVTSCIGYVRLGDWLESRGWSTVRRLLPVALVLVGAAQWPLPTRTDGYRRLPFEVTARDAIVSIWRAPSCRRMPPLRCSSACGESRRIAQARICWRPAPCSQPTGCSWTCSRRTDLPARISSPPPAR
jgi:uncharacterized membrane protein